METANKERVTWLSKTAVDRPQQSAKGMKRTQSWRGRAAGRASATK